MGAKRLPSLFTEFERILVSMSFIEGVVAHGFYDAVGQLFGNALNPLKITEPEPDDVLKEPCAFWPGCICIA
jgi:hypothetical protein